jgi:hypothetical protein
MSKKEIDIDVVNKRIKNDTQTYEIHQSFYKNKRSRRKSQ